MRRVLLIVLLLGFVPELSGCFSTNRPETDVPGEPSDDPAVITITGLIRVRRGTGDFDSGAGRKVAVTFYDTARNSDGTLKQLHQETAIATGGSVYEASFRHEGRDVAEIHLQTLRCDYDPDDPRFTCCLDPTPCPQGCESPWNPTVRVPVGEGQTRLQRDLVINCAAD